MSNDDGPANDGVSAFGAEALECVATLLLDGCELLDDLRQAIARQVVSVQAADGIALRLTIDLGEIPQGSPCPDEGIASCQPLHAVLRQLMSHVIAESPNLLPGRWVGLQESFARTKRPERESHVRLAPATLESGHLDAAAAHVESVR
jgi:hypothetical protein